MMGGECDIMKKTYKKPVAEIVEYQVQDTLLASGGVLAWLQSPESENTVDVSSKLNIGKDNGGWME